MDAAIRLFKGLPQPLPWIEPSINMMHLEVVLSYVFGAHIAAIIAEGVLLEHVLRMAVIDPVNSGINRRVSKTKLNKYRSISDIIKNQELRPLILKLMDGDETNLTWWKEIAAILRNKSAHMIINDMLRKFGTKNYLGKQFLDYIDTDPPGQWGFLWHRYGQLVSERFISEGTKQIVTIIRNTEWKPDEHWWISQKDYYESFFKFDWSLEEMQKSIAKFL